MRVHFWYVYATVDQQTAFCLVTHLSVMFPREWANCSLLDDFFSAQNLFPKKMSQITTSNLDIIVLCSGKLHFSVCCTTLERYMLKQKAFFCILLFNVQIIRIRFRKNLELRRCDKTFSYRWAGWITRSC